MQTMLRTPERGRTQEVGLQGEPVAVAANQLHHGFDALIQEQASGRHRGDVAWAALLSVQFTASTLPRSVPASSTMRAGSAESLVCSSAVTTNSPVCSRSVQVAARNAVGHGVGLTTRIRARLPQPALRHLPVASRREVLPRRRSLEPPVDRRLDVLDVIAPQRQAPRALPRATQTHFISGSTSQLPSCSVPPHGTVPQVLRAAHRAREPVECRMHCPHMRQSHTVSFVTRSTSRSARRKPLAGGAVCGGLRSSLGALHLDAPSVRPAAGP
jgi:hypothetical protein